MFHIGIFTECKENKRFRPELWVVSTFGSIVQIIIESLTVTDSFASLLRRHAHLALPQTRVDTPQHQRSMRMPAMARYTCFQGEVIRVMH